MKWAAGYEVEVPWIESTITDIAFMMYMISGRGVSSSNGKRAVLPNSGAVRTSSALKAATWLLDDFGVAQALRFRATELR